MTEGLREFDDSIGRCNHCRKLVFKGEPWVIQQWTSNIVHRECESEYMRKCSQI